MSGDPSSITINRAPVLTLWAAVVAERLGFDRDASVTLGRALAGLNAQAKGRGLGIFSLAEPGAAEKRRRTLKPGEELAVELLGRAVPAIHTREGIRALDGTRAADPKSAERYLESKFGESLDKARQAMAALAKSLPNDELAARAFALYEAFRPSVPAGTRGWGAKGVLDLDLIRSLAKQHGAKR